MTHPPYLTDRAALDRNRRRAMRLGFEPFLHAEAADEIEERLIEVNRRFTEPAIVTGFPEFWRERMPGARLTGDADILDLRPGAHDLVIHALALHWANDPVGQLIQCRRALRPDGLFLGVMFGGRTLAELRAVMAETETRLHAGLSPRVAPMGEIRDLGGLLQRAWLCAAGGGFGRPDGELRGHGGAHARPAADGRGECAGGAGRCAGPAVPGRGGGAVRTGVSG